MSNRNFVLLGQTQVGRSEMPAALEAEMHRLQGDQSIVVLQCSEVGVPQGHVGRLIGNPHGYVTTEKDGQPPAGLLAALALGRMQRGDLPFIFLDDPDLSVDPLMN